MAQIFLSYSRRDADAAKALASGLSARGHEVWWDKNISGGSEFAAEIEQALNAADIVMVLWSSVAVKSPWVLDEAAEGRDTGRLLPIALDDCKPPLGFRQYQTIFVVRTRPEAAIEDILQALVRKTAGRDAALTFDQQAPPIDPDSAEAHCATARQLAEAGKHDEAQGEIELALSIDPNAGEANAQAARLIYAQGRAADAIGYCERAVATMKYDHECASLLISCHQAVQNGTALKQAAELTVARAEQAIASGLSMGPAFASGAKGLAAMGHLDRARKWLRKALNVDPGNLPMRYNVAATLAGYLNDGEAAIDVLEPFVEHVNDRTQLHLLETDPDWSPIAQSRGFQSLLARARKRVEALEATGFAGQHPDTTSSPPPLPSISTGSSRPQGGC